MAQKTINIDDFYLKSTWTYKSSSSTTGYYTDPTSPSTASKTVSVDLSSIPAGSRVTSATLSLNNGGGGPAYAIASGVSVRITDSSMNVSSWFSSLPSSLSIKFTFSAWSEGISYYSTTKTGSYTNHFSSIILTINYELPNSTGKLNKSSVPANGSTITLTITPTNSAYTHRVDWLLEGNTSSHNHSRTQTLAAGTTTDTWTIASSFADAIPNGTSKTASVTLSTINNGTTIGSVTYTFTITIPSSVTPTVDSGGGISYTVVDGWSGELVQNMSKATLILSGAHAGTGATISSVVFSGWGATANGSVSGSNYTATTGVLTSGGYKTVKAVITDSRGRSLTVTATNLLPVRTYSYPVITSVTAKRCRKEGSSYILDDMGTFVNVSVNYSYWRINNESYQAQNSVVSSNRVVYYKESTASSYTTSPNRLSDGTVTSTAVKNNISGATAIVHGGDATNGAISTDKSYNIRVRIIDALGNIANAVVTVPTTKYVFHFRDGGRAVGIGRAASDTDDSLMINEDWLVSVGGGDISPYGKGAMHNVYKGILLAGVDLNNITDFGYYAVHSDTVDSISNLPVQDVGVLVVRTACDNERGRAASGVYWSGLQLYYTRTGSIYKRYISTSATAGEVSVGAWAKLATVNDVTASNLSGTVPINKGGTGASTLIEAKRGLGVSMPATGSITLPENTVIPGIITNGRKNAVFTISLNKELPSSAAPSSLSGNVYLLTHNGKISLNGSDGPFSILSIGSANITVNQALGIININFTASDTYESSNNVPVSMLVANGGLTLSWS